jgi:hypothetical protein
MRESVLPDNNYQGLLNSTEHFLRRFRRTCTNLFTPEIMLRRNTARDTAVFRVITPSADPSLPETYLERPRHRVEFPCQTTAAGGDFSSNQGDPLCN